MGANGDRCLIRKCNVCYCISRNRAGKSDFFCNVTNCQGNGSLCDGDGLTAAVIVKGKAKCFSAKRGVHRITERYIFSIAFWAVFRNGNGVPPHGCPFCLIHNSPHACTKKYMVTVAQVSNSCLSVSIHPFFKRVKR